jgi:hypothetical protein
MARPHRSLQPNAIVKGLAVLAALCALAGLVAAGPWRAPQPVVIPLQPAGPGPALPAKHMVLAAAFVSAPAHPGPAADEWTSDAPAFQARQAQSRLAAPAPPLPPQAAKADAGAQPVAAKPAQPVALALAQPAPARDDAKLCRTPQLPLDVAQAAAAPRLQISREPRLGGKPLDIAPPEPPPEQEQRIRLSALLAEALEQ